MFTSSARTSHCTPPRMPSSLRAGALALAVLTSMLPVHAQMSPGPLARPHQELDTPLQCFACHGKAKGSMNEQCIACHADIGWLIEHERGFHAARKADDVRDAAIRTTRGATSRWCGGRRGARRVRPQDGRMARSKGSTRRSSAATATRRSTPSRPRRSCPSEETRRRVGSASSASARACHEDVHRGVARAGVPVLPRPRRLEAGPQVRPRQDELSADGKARPGQVREVPHRRRPAEAGLQTDSRTPSARRATWTLTPAAGAGLRQVPRHRIVPDRGGVELRSRQDALPAAGEARRSQVRAVSRSGQGVGEEASVRVVHAVPQGSARGHGDDRGPGRRLRRVPSGRRLQGPRLHGGAAPESPLSARRAGTGRSPARPVTSRTLRASRPRSSARQACRSVPTFTRCLDCHRDDHGGQLASRPGGAACEPCHNVAGWKPSLFGAAEHAKLKLPLEGRHAKIECAACHGPAARGCLPSRRARCSAAPASR